MRSGPPRRLKIGEVPNYLKRKYNLTVSRQTIYNWIKKGLRNDSLQYTAIKDKPTAKYPSVWVTTEEWVDDFLRRCGIELTPVGGGDDRPGQAEDAGPAEA